MDSKLGTIKQYIYSLLTASPLAMTMIQLNKEYRNTIGEPIPYQKLGYNSLEHLLKSIPDTVRVRGSGPMAEVIPVLQKKSSHVMEMVSSQKKPTPKRREAYYGARTVVVTPMNNPKPSPKPLMQQIMNNPQKMFYPKPSNTNKSSPALLPTPPPNQPFLSTKPPVNTRPAISYTNHNSPKKSPPVNNVKLENGNYSSTAPKGRINNILVPPTTTHKTQESYINSHKPAENRFDVNTEKWEGKKEKEPQSSWTGPRKRLYKVDKVQPPTENVEERVPIVIRNNLKKMISQYPNGIWCAKIPEVYREMFKTGLKYQELGFNNLIDLCLLLESVFHYVRPSFDDFKLYDRSKPLPDCAEQSFTIASYSEKKTPDVEMKNALPTIDWSDVLSFLPPGTFNPGREIPRAFLPAETRENDCVDVVVGEIYDLSKFWVYKEVDKLNDLMDDMQLFYKSNYLEYFMTKQLIREGVYCVQIIFGEYHRALIVDLTPLHEDMIRVIFIDYGTMAKVPIKDLCFLHEQFAELPAQAMRCRLANICPPEKGAPWSRESSKEFRNLIRKRNLTAKISRINWKDQYMEVSLADTTDENNVFYINDRLVDLGYAVYSDKGQKDSIVDSISKPLVNFIHLFPTFAELEHGLAPSTGEMEILYDCNVPINFCYPQYFITDTTDEEKIIERAVDFHEKHCLRGVRESSLHASRCIDRSKTNPSTPLDFSIFGSLETELREFHQATASGEVSASCSGKNLEKIAERLGFLRSKTVDELRKDCLLSEDIMNEILSACGSRGCDSTPEEPGESPQIDDETPQAFADLDVVEAHLRMPSFETDISEMPSFETDNSKIKPSFETDISGMSSFEPDTSKDVQAGPEECAQTDLAVRQSTNPFLNGLVDAGEETDVLPTLNPNNPFLSYVMKPKEEYESDGSDRSSGSTVYGTNVEEVVVTEKWSTADTVSEVTSLSGYSTAESLHRRTIEEATLQPARQPPPFYPVPCAYPEWAGFNNPYYRARFAHFGYHQQQFYPPMGGYGFGMQAPRPAVCPPPGFGGGFVGQAGPFGFVPGQYNRVSHTSVSNVSITSEMDFYERYNERLRIAEAAANK